MIENIFSKVEPDKLLHTIYRCGKFENRVDITSEDKYLQGAVIGMNKGKKYRSHKHITCERNTDITQEAWLVFRGSVNVKYYDVNSELLKEDTIHEGDCSITFGGGHGFEGGSDDTIVYEFKMGPYFGREADKVFIDEEE